MPHPVKLKDVASILEIQMLKARYFRCVDSKDWEGLRRVFTPDATLHFEEAQDEPAGVEDSIAFIATGVEGSTSIHHGHMPEIEILSPTEAVGLWTMEDRLFWPPERPSRLGLEHLHGLGHYHESYARQGGQWLIHRLRVTRQWVNAVPSEHAVAD